VPDQPLFCARPFKRFEVSHGGQVYMCCKNWLRTPIGDLNTQSVQEIWNGPVARDIRRSIHDGSFEYCSRERCPFLQTATGPVKPVDRLSDPDLQAAAARRLTELPYGPREIDCAYDRSCNLTCPSCRTKLIVETENEKKILELQGKLEREALADAHYLGITGSGDPFGSPYFRRWLQTMRRADMPKLRLINLQTNAMLWTPALWKTIPEDVRALIKGADISIDAASPGTYAVNRRGGDFHKLLRNLEFVSALRRDGPLRWVVISMVVQENNFAEMPAFVELGRRLGFDVVYFSQLTDWGTYGEGEYERRAIHRPQHPRHAELLAVLDDPLFASPLVQLGNLTAARRRQAVP